MIQYHNYVLMSYCSADNAIKDFMEFYRQSFPDASVIPKMHILEEHVVRFLRKWGVGCGFLGEQGAESIHIN